ncbi:hypothetical protein EV121DRAFT_278677 [Schizophyllum commune]
MMPSGAHGNVESTLSSSAPLPVSRLPSALRSHWKLMIPMLQAFTNTNRVHTEHEDYAFWNTVITYLTDAFMKRPASVVPQPKLWVLPKDVRMQLKSKKHKVALQLPVASLPPALTALARPESPAATAADAGEQVTSNTMMQLQLESTSAPSTSILGQPDVAPQPSRSALPLEDLEARLKSFQTLTNPPAVPASIDLPAQATRSDAEEMRGSHITIPRDEVFLLGDLSELEDSFLDKSTSTTPTEKTKGKKHVVSDFGVVTPIDRYPFTAEQIAQKCADTRRKLDEASRLPPDAEDFIPYYRCETEDYSSDDEEYESDDEYVPEETLDATPTPSDIRLRSHTAAAQNANPTTSHAPPQPHGPHVAAAATAPAQPDWLASDIGSAGWLNSDKPYAQVCNHKETFKRLKFLVNFAVAMLWEGKRSASRKLEEEAYRKKTYWRFYKAMRSLMIQALFVLTTEACKQDKVVCVAMVSDFWSWNVFERIKGREVRIDWLSYTPETAPIKSCYPWSQPLQWGSPESDEAVIMMMHEVNTLFPPLPTSLSQPGSDANDPATATNPSEPSPQAPARPNSGAAPSRTTVVAAQSAQASAPSDGATGQERTEVSVDDASLEHAKDRPTSSGPAPRMQRPPLIGAPAPSADVIMSDAALSSNAAAIAGPEATAPAPLSRVPWRGLRRNDTEDTEPDAPRRPLPIQANNPNDSGVSRSLLHGHRTMATLDALDAMDINANGAVGSSANALTGNVSVQAPAAVVPATAAQASGSGNAPTNSGNPRKRSASASSDGEVDDRAQVAKKVKRAPASIEPSAEAGPGPSTQASRSRAPSKGKKRKYNGAMAQAYAQVHPRNEKGHFVKKQ